MKTGALRDNLWEHVYLLEFYQKEEVSDSFAFGVPPESEEFVLGMRKTETKTFAGLVVDDYGADVLKITLTGTSVNNELRVIYHSESQREFLTGEQEVFRLKYLLEKYKRDKKRMGEKILLYDLSKHSMGARRRKSVESFCWQVYPGELKIKRSKERPLAYTYSIEFTAEKYEKKPIPYNTVLGIDFNKAFDALNEYLNKIEEKMSVLKQGLSKVNETRLFVKKCKEVAYLAVGGTINAFQIVIDDTFSIGQAAFDLYKETAGGTVPFAMDNFDFVACMVIDLLTHINILAANMKSIASKELYVPVGVFDDWEIAREEISSLLELGCNDAYRTACAIAVAAKVERPKKYELQIGKNQTITAYGTKVVLVTDGMSFDSIAQEHYGDVHLSCVIAQANSASSIEDVIARKQTVLFIPVLEKNEANFNNLIIGLSGQRDNYGVDIFLDKNGNMVLNDSKTDFVFVSERKNLSQGILMRLRENINKRVKLQLYGIKTSLPDNAQAGAAYILSSIIQTLNQEPRIKELLGVSFKGEGDVLKIDIDYKDIDGSKTNITGII